MAVASAPVPAAAPAGFGRRFGASLIDWTICLLIPFMVASAAASAIWLVIVPACVLGYFAGFLSGGRTLGMKAASIRISDARTGHPPSVRKAVARSLLSLLQVASVVPLLYFAFSDVPGGGYSAADLAVLATSSLIAVGGVIVHLSMCFDPERRTLLDRLCGLAIRG
jgi:uncharacterized RDD family membrane protein YckC